jgi:hypothetical protein
MNMGIVSSVKDDDGKVEREGDRWQNRRNGRNKKREEQEKGSNTQFAYK